MSKRIWSMALMLVAVVAPLYGQFVVVKDGKPQVTLFAAAEHREAAKVAMQQLTNYVAKSTGTELLSADASGARQIRLAVQGDMDRDAFTFTFPAEDVMVITGGSGNGLEYAAYEFLERYLGIRWLFPGEIGEYIPTMTEVVIPRQEVAQSPSFLSRTFSGTFGEDSGVFRKTPAWMRKMRASSIRVQFHHNLWRLFPGELGVEHPEYFPMRNGERFVPKPEDQVSWQPCFTAPGSADAAAERIRDFWTKNPARDSYSLGVNDGVGFCTCETCQAVNGDRNNFAGYAHVTPSFIQFANRLAERLRGDFPERKFGFLAYVGILEPPEDMAVDPALVPFMTFDRMMWLDPEKEKGGKELTIRWKEKVPNLGWYDYIYGRFYSVPRIYFHHAADYLRWGHEHGVRHYYAEYYPAGDWHEGPKFYLTMKLCWNLGLDVDALLDEWYVCAVGAEAAPLLKDYYASLERFWTTVVPQTDWFRSGKQYLPFKSSDYLVALDPAEISRFEQLLDKMASLSTHPERAQFIRQSFLNWKEKVAAPIARRQMLRQLETTEFKPLQAVDYNARDVKVSSWQRDYSRGSFGWDEAAGRGASGAVYIDTAGSQGTPMCYLHNVRIETPQKLKASVWFRAEGVDEGTGVKLEMRWQAPTSQGANARDPQWRAADSNTAVSAPEVKNGEWQQLTLYNITPSELPCRLVVLYTVTNTMRGRVYFDDLQIGTTP